MAASPEFKVAGFTPGTGNDHTANVLRWGTMFNYRFTTTVAPALGTVQIGLWRPGTPNSFSVALPTPGGADQRRFHRPVLHRRHLHDHHARGLHGHLRRDRRHMHARSLLHRLVLRRQRRMHRHQRGRLRRRWTGGGSCEPNICPAPTGACCVATVCSITTQAGCSGSWTGAGTTCSASTCNNNNLCSAAVPLCDNVAVNGTTTSATNDGTATCGNSGSSPDVWFSYVPATTGTINVNTCGSGYDTVVSVYTGNCAARTQVACNDDNATNGGNNACGGGLPSGVNVTMTAGTAYLIRVAGYNSATGSFTVRAVGGGGQGCLGARPAPAAAPAAALS